MTTPSVALSEREALLDKKRSWIQIPFKFRLPSFRKHTQNRVKDHNDTTDPPNTIPTFLNYLLSLYFLQLPTTFKNLFSYRDTHVPP